MLLVPVIQSMICVTSVEVMMWTSGEPPVAFPVLLQLGETRAPAVLECRNCGMRWDA